MILPNSIPTLLCNDDGYLSREEFFEAVRMAYFSTQDSSFMVFYLSMVDHEDEFIVHQNKLVEYGIIPSIRSGKIETNLKNLNLEKEVDYQIVSISNSHTRGTKQSEIVYLTPLAFKICLIKSQGSSDQLNNSTNYFEYYLLLERVYKLYTDYDRMCLKKLLLRIMK